MPLETLALPVAALAEVLQTIVMVLFLLSAFLLTVVVLLQEGKGGGLSGAFGGAGAEAFGVKAGTVNKFTAWLGAAFLGLALLHAGLVSASSTFSLDDPSTAPPVGGLLDPDEDEGPSDAGPDEDAPGDSGGSDEGGSDDGGAGDGDGETPPGDDG